MRLRGSEFLDTVWLAAGLACPGAFLSLIGGPFIHGSLPFYECPTVAKVERAVWAGLASVLPLALPWFCCPKTGVSPFPLFFIGIAGSVACLRKRVIDFDDPKEAKVRVAQLEEMKRQVRLLSREEFIKKYPTEGIRALLSEEQIIHTLLESPVERKGDSSKV